MKSRRARRVTLACLLLIPVFTTACPPPWAFWRHDHRNERYERRDDHRGERHERHDDRRGERRERHERH